MDGLVRLDDVCQEYFAIGVKTARTRASMGQLPVPAFRLSASRKGPFYVRQSDLQQWVQRRINEATTLHSHMKEAGLV